MTGASGSSVRPRPLAMDERERDIVHRLAQQDPAALADLYDAYGGFVCGIAARLLPDRAAVEDVTQEVFLNVWRRPDAFDPDAGSLRGWLAMLTHRRAVDHLRRERAAHRSEDVAPAPAPALDAGDIATSRAVARRVRQAVQALPPEQRDAVRLAYFGGKTYRQVASVLSIPEGTAKTRLRLALSKMANELEREGFAAC